MNDPMLPLPGLSPVSGKSVVAQFDGGLLSSNGGVLALREVEKRLRVADRFAACIEDPRAPDQITHTLADIIRAKRPKGMCGRPLRCKKNLWTAAARDRVLPCVRPLLRRLTGRGPVWEFVDQVHITEARSKRSPFAWFS